MKTEQHPMFGGKGIPAWMDGLDWYPDPLREGHQRIVINLYVEGDYKFQLSVVGGGFECSHPRSKVAWADYQELEVGFFRNSATTPLEEITEEAERKGLVLTPITRSNLTDPKMLGWFDSDGVAPFIPTADIRRLAFAIIDAHGAQP